MHIYFDLLSLSLPVYFGGAIPDPLFLLYLGPQTVLPVASIIAALVGVILMFWRLIFRFIKKIINSIQHKPGVQPEINTKPVVPSNNPNDEIRN